VLLHGYRYGQTERALKWGYRERFAQQALGHNSRAVHHAYSKHAEVTVPSLDDWERQWKQNSQKIIKPAVVQVDFQARNATPSGTECDAPAAVACQAGG